MTFTSFINPVKQVTGKAAYIESTRRFFSMIVAVEVKDLIVDGEKACALTRYQLKPPTGDSFNSDVAEIFTVRNNQIESLSIFFDTSPFPK
jgi:ketosteroid isomerase-like protein